MFPPRALLAAPNPSAMWKTATTAEGKTYYYNAITKETCWTMPPAMSLSTAICLARSNRVAVAQNEAPQEPQPPQQPFLARAQLFIDLTNSCCSQPVCR